MGSGLSETVDDGPGVMYTLPTNHYPFQHQQASENHSNGDVHVSKLPWFYKESQDINFVNDGNINAVKVSGMLF